MRTYFILYSHCTPFKYLMYFFEQLLQLPDPKDPESLDRLLPWSKALPLTCRVFKA
jgi:hypothetical protein